MIPGFPCQERESDYLCLFRSCEELHEHSILICPRPILWKFPCRHWIGNLGSPLATEDPCRRQTHRRPASFNNTARTSVTRSYFFPEISAKFRAYVSFFFCSSLGHYFYSLSGANICLLSVRHCPLWAWGACQSMRRARI